MKHKTNTRTLGRDYAHRLSMLRNLSRSLIQARQIETTHARALEVYVFSKIGCNQDSRDLFDLVKAQFTEVNGGYTSIIKYRFRKGDGAHMVILKLNV